MIKTIPDKIQLTDISTTEDNQFEVSEAIEYTFDYLGRTFNTTVPKGFITDLGSVPVGVRPIISNTGRYIKSYVLHDWLYDSGCDLNITKNDADIILWLGLKEQKMDWWKMNLVYQSVRLFGGSHWRSTSVSTGGLKND